MHTAKAICDKVGKIDPTAFGAATKNAGALAMDDPGMLIDARYDDKGDFDRAGFIVKVGGGKAEVVTTLEPKW